MERHADFYQQAWVVPRLEPAIDHWVKHAQVGPFFVSEGTQPTKAFYRGQPQRLDCRIALAQAGRVQIELIEQVSAGPSVYRELVPEGRTGFHHIMQLTKTFDADVRAHCRRGLEVAAHGEIEDLRYAYLDASATLGCMLEIVSDIPMIRSLFGQIADAAAGWDGREPIRFIAKP